MVHRCIPPAPVINKAQLPPTGPRLTSTSTVCGLKSPSPRLHRRPLTLQHQLHNMDKIGLVLLIFSFVCFCLAAKFETHWQKLMAAGGAFLTAAMIFGNVGTVFK